MQKVCAGGFQYTNTRQHSQATAQQCRRRLLSAAMLRRRSAPLQVAPPTPSPSMPGDAAADPCFAARAPNSEPAPRQRVDGDHDAPHQQSDGAAASPPQFFFTAPCSVDGCMHVSTSSVSASGAKGNLAVHRYRHHKRTTFQCAACNLTIENSTVGQHNPVCKGAPEIERTCAPCGGLIVSTRRGLWRHQQTQKHKNAIAEQRVASERAERRQDAGLGSLFLGTFWVHYGYIMGTFGATGAKSLVQRLRMLKLDRHVI